MLPCHIYMVYPDPQPPAIPSPADALTMGQRRLVAVLEVLLCSSLPTQIVIGQLLAAAGVSPGTDTGELSAPFAFSLLLIDSVVLTALMIALTRAHGDSPRRLWLGTRPIPRDRPDAPVKKTAGDASHPRPVVCLAIRRQPVIWIWRGRASSRRGSVIVSTPS